LLPTVKASPENEDGLAPLDHEVMRQVLLKCGVPAPAIVQLPNEVNSTADEARSLKHYLDDHAERRVAVVTNAYHTAGALDLPCGTRRPGGGLGVLRGPGRRLRRRQLVVLGRRLVLLLQRVHQVRRVSVLTLTTLERKVSSVTMTKPTYILGLNSFHADASAVLLRDGELVAAVAEERLNRVKHFAGFPTLAVKEVLDIGGIGLADVDHVGINKDSRANLLAKVGFALGNLPRITRLAKQRLEYRAKAQNTPQLLCEALGVPADALKARVHNVEYHLCHVASCFLVSEFERAAVLSIDGFGDFASTMTAVATTST
jgi:hypothetical protein